MKTTKTFKVVILPSEKASPIGLHFDINPKGELNYAPNLGFELFDKNKNYQHNPQHLYIISYEIGKQIPIGDYIYNGEYNEVYKKEANNSWEQDLLIGKIIASTDKSLVPCSCKLGYKCDDSNCIPQIPESFIKAYIKAYNEGIIITEVDLEVEYNKYPDLHSIEYEIKTRPDNTVIIHESKKYSKEELYNICYALCQQAWDNGIEYYKLSKHGMIHTTFEEWIQTVL